MSLNYDPYYTYDDVLIKPKYSDITSRKNVSLTKQLTPNIKLHVPIISSNMDTITEDIMAIEMAKLGGLGIIHRYCTIDSQVEMVKKVKRYTNYIITEPYTIDESSNMGEVLSKIKNTNKSLLVINSDNILKGIITQRDLIHFNSIGHSDHAVLDFMTAIHKMITIERIELNGLEIQDLIKILTSNKIQKLPITENGALYGLITLKDMLDRSVNNIFKPNLDANSQLVVGCAIGVNKDYLERAYKVINAGCDIICIDVAHGHHQLCGNAVKEIRRLYPEISIIAGNVCTAAGVEYLAKCGADCVKVGIGPGGICITRRQTGCGAPQLTSVIKCAKKAKELGVTVIADGGHNGCIGNIFKALCCGSSASMLGGMLSGTLETPGQIYTKLDRKVKQIRGMAGIMSNYNKAEKLGQSTNNLETMTPEGVEGYVTYKGPVKDIINQICGGLRSGLSYVGCNNLEDLNPDEIEFILITQSGYQESGSHGISEL
uniref:CBS domain-containing protein n=1 Tax=viral metagenome TaxID=1070528 RepID=A0A6C0B2U6_9ZZZZ